MKSITIRNEIQGCGYDVEMKQRSFTLEVRFIPVNTESVIEQLECEYHTHCFHFYMSVNQEYSPLSGV